MITSENVRVIAFSFLSWPYQGSSRYYIDDGNVATSTNIWKAGFVQYVAIQWRSMSPLAQDAAYFSKLIDLRSRNLMHSLHIYYHLLQIVSQANTTRFHLSTLIQVMPWCRQAASNYLNQSWPRPKSSYGVSKPECLWVNLIETGSIVSIVMIKCTNHSKTYQCDVRTGLIFNGKYCT